MTRHSADERYQRVLLANTILATNGVRYACDVTSGSAWGTPSCPLAPRSYRVAYAERQVPFHLAGLGRLSVGKLNADLWQHLEHETIATAKVRKARYHQVLKWLALLPIPEDLECIPGGLPLSWVSSLPLSDETRDLVTQLMITKDSHASFSGVSLAQLPISQPYQIRMVIEMLCVIESCEVIPRQSSVSQDTTPSLLGAVGLQGSAATVRPLSPNFTVSPSSHKAKKTSSRSKAESDDKTLTASSCESITDHPTFLEKLMFPLRTTASSAPLVVMNLTMRQVAAQHALGYLAAFWDFLLTRDRVIFEHRIAPAEPVSLEELGQRLGITRERVRQLQKLIETKWRHPSTTGTATGYCLYEIAKAIRHQVGPVTDCSTIENFLVTTFDFESTADNQILNIAYQLLYKELGYTYIESTCMDSTALAVIDDLKAAARSIADEVGLINEYELRDYLPNESWWKHWDILVQRCHLHRIEGYLTLRNTKKAKVKAALLSIGRPATRQEIGDRCGVDPARVGSHLSVINTVVRADKKRWALAEWVDDIYEGIPAEITQRINEGGGSVHISHLLDELPKKFGVHEKSVRAYIASPAFRLDHGWVSVTDQPDLSLATLDEIVHGYTTDGEPYWIFEMCERYRKGYSIVGVPPELIIAIGGSLGCNITLPVLRPRGCSDISVIWRRTAFTGPEIGRVASSLIAIDASQNDPIRLIIHQSGVSFAHHDYDQRPQTMRHHLPDPTNRSHTTASTSRHGGVSVAETIRARIRFQDETSSDPITSPYIDYWFSSTASYRES